MSPSLNDPMQNIAKGTGIIFIGVVATLVLNFLLRMVMIRYVTEDEYGIYSIAVLLAGLVGAVAMLGLDEGVARHIAFFAGKSEDSRVGRIIASSLRITLASSLVFAALMFVFSDVIATAVFHSTAMSGALRIMSAAIPLTALLQVLTSIMRGLHEPWARAFFKDTLRPLLFLILMVGIIMLRLPFDSIIYAYVASMAIALAALAVYAARARPDRPAASAREDRSVTKDLLSFSLPLLSVNLLMLLMSQATMLILGYFENPGEAGKYDLAVTAASLLLIVINSMGYIYTPTASSLFGKGRMEELRQSYVASTRWGYILTVPVLFPLLLFTAPIVELLYGAKYLGIVLVLQIIVVGYMVNPVTGPNYHTLIAAGRMRAIVESFLLNAISNVALCLLLIPSYGIEGAAVAASVSSAVANLLLSLRLYQQMGIHPLTRSYLLSVVSSVALLGAFYAVFQFVPGGTSIFLVPVWSGLYLVAYVASLFVFHAIDAEDIKMLGAIEKRLGLKVTPVLVKYVR
jgi:Membrane protein involved in the export of O-antigen and teichoic acid